jgi:hypothetical protein
MTHAMTASKSAPSARIAALSTTIPPEGCARPSRLSKERIASSSTLPSLVVTQVRGASGVRLRGGKAGGGTLRGALQVSAALGGGSRAFWGSRRVAGKPATGPSGRFAKPSDVRFAHVQSGLRS